MLEQSESLSYLLSLGLVKPRFMANGDLAVEDASRRNRVFLVTRRGGPTHVVKQAGPAMADALRHEASVLRTLAGIPGLAERVPDVAYEDPEAGVLVLRSPAGAPDWIAVHRAGRFPRLLPVALGRVLGTLHDVAARDLPEPSVNRMWGLTLPEPTYESVLTMSTGAKDVVARLQASPSTCERLAALRADVDDDAFVHGDLRWDNCLAIPAPGRSRRTRVMVIDWEMAGRGSAAFDVGTIIAEYLRTWVGSIPIVAPSDPGRLLAHATRPLARMQPAIAAFWSAYQQARRSPPALGRVVQLSAVRVLQIAVELAQVMTVPTAHVVTLVQVADNMLAAPESAAVNLLGLRA